MVPVPESFLDIRRRWRKVEYGWVGVEAHKLPFSCRRGGDTKRKVRSHDQVSSAFGDSIAWM